MLRREGHDIYEKRTRRIYRELGMHLRNKTAKRRIEAKLREARQEAIGPNDVGAVDFVHDQLATGTKLRILTVVTPSSRYAPALDPRFNYRAENIVSALDKACSRIDYPEPSGGQRQRVRLTRPCSHSRTMSRSAISPACAGPMSVTSAPCSPSRCSKPCQYSGMVCVPGLALRSSHFGSAPGSWADVTTASVGVIDGLAPEHSIRSISFIADFPTFWTLLQDPMSTALQETVDNTAALSLTDFSILWGLSVPQFRPSPLQLLAGLFDEQLEQAIAAVPSTDLWPRAVDRYRRSGSIRAAA